MDNLPVNQLNSRPNRSRRSLERDYDEISTKNQNCATCGVKCAWGFPYSRIIYCHLHNQSNSFTPATEFNSKSFKTVHLSSLKFDDDSFPDLREESSDEVIKMTKKQKRDFIKEYESNKRELKQLKLEREVDKFLEK